MSDIKDWSTTAASNNSASPDGFPEGMAPSGVNDSAREVMAAVREFYNALEWRDWGHTIAYGSATTFTTAAGDGDTTAIYHAGRRIRANGATTGTIYGVVSSSSHAAQTTVTVAWDSGSLQNEALTIWVGFASDTQFIGRAEFDGGTGMVFMQAAAPTGWTIDTSFDGRALFFKGTYNSEVKAGGETGGTHGPGLMDKVPTHTHPGTGLTATTTDSANWQIMYGISGGAPRGALGAGLGAYAGPSYQTSISGSVAANTSASTWAPKYACGICASKD